LGKQRIGYSQRTIKLRTTDRTELEKQNKNLYTKLSSYLNDNS